MSNEMIERIAKAMYDSNQFARPLEKSPNWVEHYRRQARAAISAMREPTDAMKHAGADSYGIQTPAIGTLPLSVIDGQPSKAWRAMIDEALK